MWKCCCKIDDKSLIKNWETDNFRIKRVVVNALGIKNSKFKNFWAKLFLVQLLLGQFYIHAKLLQCFRAFFFYEYIKQH